MYLNIGIYRTIQGHVDAQKYGQEKVEKGRLDEVYGKVTHIYIRGKYNIPLGAWSPVGVYCLCYIIRPPPLKAPGL